MTDILQSPSQLSSKPSSISPTNNDGFHQQTFVNHKPLINRNPADLCSRNCRSRQIQQVVETEEREEVSVLAVVLTVVRKSLVGCKSVSGENCGIAEKLMEIGWPTNVRHIAHVTFDKFNGFLGLPVEFEPEVSRKPPSASTRVFGVSTESMQLSFDPRGNCVPTILLMMQRRLYLQGGLQSEGIFRINPENSQEEYVREQLNNGIIPENIDVHCLAGLIKAWFRELPNGILDPLPPDQVMEAQSEDECSHLVRLLPHTEAALLDWAINLMADVAQFEQFNKMNARNIAMVFAPNMTEMSDPLTALMYAVQVMNFLKTLVEKTLRDRQDCLDDSGPTQHLEPSDEDSHYTKPSNDLQPDETSEENEEEEVAKEPPLANQISSTTTPLDADSRTGNETHGFLNSIENILCDGMTEKDDSQTDVPNARGTVEDILEGGKNTIRRSHARRRRIKTEQASKGNDAKKVSSIEDIRTEVRANEKTEKKKDVSAVSRVNSLTGRAEAWR